MDLLHFFTSLDSQLGAVIAAHGNLISYRIGISFWIASLMIAGYYFGEIPFVREHMASIILSGLAIGITCIIIDANLSGSKQKS